MIGPLTQVQRLALLWRRPNKSARAHKRRHRAFIRFRAESDGCHSPAIYRSARKVLPLP